MPGDDYLQGTLRHALSLIFVVAGNHPASIQVCCKCNIYGAVYVCRRGVVLTTHPHLSAEVMKG